MKHSTLSRWMTALYAIGVTLLISFTASAAIEDKFKGERREDAASFAEHTRDLFTDDYFAALDDRWGLQYRLNASEQGAEIALRDRVKRVESLLSNIKQYSQQILIIAESAQSDGDKARALANYLAPKVGQMALALALDEHAYDAVIDKVQKQKNLREGLRAAQPLFDAAEQLMTQHLTTIEQQIIDVNTALLAQINQHYEPVIALHQKLLARKRPLLQRLAQQLPAKLDSADQTELNYLIAVQTLIESDYNHLLATQQVVDEAKLSLLNDVARLHSVISIWVRAHGKMSKGVYHSAEWFELDELPKRLVKKIVP